MNSVHAVVWIDHNEAKVFHIDAEALASATIHPGRHIRRHAERKHPADDQNYYHQVVEALGGAREILVLGPANAKLDFVKHVRKCDPALEPKIVGVETVDHPTDKQLVAFARQYFQAVDRMLGTAP